jgi:lantibiotic transport system ATP-binding protein
MNFAIQTQLLSFGYSHSTPIIQDLSLNVPKGSIYGFLGPNGAGKSTTIRLITGLLGNHKNITIMGQALKNNEKAIFKTIGTLIETPSLYEHLTAYENLQIVCKYFGAAESRIMDVLKTVDLDSTGQKKVKHFSMGMKQRLGIAQALIPDPELLILDEPVNGLDPQGIRKIRELLITLNQDQGKTIFLSSHLLSEIEKTCTHVGVIHNGKLCFEGTLEQLKHQKEKKNAVHFEVDNWIAAQAIMNKNGLVCEKPDNELLKAIISNKQSIANVTKQLVENNIEVYSIQNPKETLEDWFLELTEG